MDLISFGPIFLELVFGHVRQLPLPGEEIYTDEFALSCGGAVTSATAAARGGAQAGICTVLGDDFGSRVVVEHCAAHGVDTSPSLRVPGRSTGITVVLNFDDDRAFVTHAPPRPAETPARIERWREVLRRERPRWCYVHAGEGVADFLREARDLGVKVILDVTLHAARRREMVAECARLADVFVPNEAELQRLTGASDPASAQAAARAWQTLLVVKRGAAGALVADPDGVTEVTAGVREVKVRDLTGAGDAFAGALVAALLRESPLEAAVAAANEAGSAAVARLGAVGEIDIAGISIAGWVGRQPFSDEAAAMGSFGGHFETGSYGESGWGRTSG